MNQEIINPFPEYKTPGCLPDKLFFIKSSFFETKEPYPNRKTEFIRRAQASIDLMDPDKKYLSENQRQWLINFAENTYTVATMISTNLDPRLENFAYISATSAFVYGLTENLYHKDSALNPDDVTNFSRKQDEGIYDSVFTKTNECLPIMELKIAQTSTYFDGIAALKSIHSYRKGILEKKDGAQTTPLDPGAVLITYIYEIARVRAFNQHIPNNGVLQCDELMKEFQTMAYNAYYTDNVGENWAMLRPLLSRVGTVLNDYRLNLVAYPAYALGNLALLQLTGHFSPFDRMLEGTSNSWFNDTHKKLLEGAEPDIEQNVKGVWSLLDKIFGNDPYIDGQLLNLIIRYKPYLDARGTSNLYESKLFNSEFRFVRMRERSMALTALAELYYAQEYIDPIVRKDVGTFLREFLLSAQERVTDVYKIRAYFKPGGVNKFASMLQDTDLQENTTLHMERGKIVFTPDTKPKFHGITETDRRPLNQIHGVEIERIIDDFVATNSKDEWPRIYAGLFLNHKTQGKNCAVPVEIHALQLKHRPTMIQTRAEYKRD